MARDQLTDLNFGGVTRPTNLPNAAAAGDAVPLGQVQALISLLNWKDSVRVAAPANVNIAAPGASIDGVALANGDRVLLPNQTTVTQNGIYIFNGSASAMTRSADADLFDELEGAIVRVEEGTGNGGTGWRQTQVNGVVGTNNIVFVTDSSSAPSASEGTAGIAAIATQAETDAGTNDTKFVTALKLKTSKLFNKSAVGNLGDGSALTFNLDHNLGTRDVVVSVYRNSGSYDDVIADVTRPTVNRVTVTFATAPALNAYRVVIQATQA